MLTQCEEECKAGQLRPAEADAPARQVNARKIYDEPDVLAGVTENRLFLGILGGELLLQAHRPANPTLPCPWPCPGGLGCTSVYKDAVCKGACLAAPPVTAECGKHA